ncbi:hypothetical protein PR202_gn00449 [Eleusine coracana subsp. coracana]|uniref:Uncharacterized protein n=1 Tax=Eleusine coracana subsp. coracana TaxID=191504 RepID=A0AAV5G2M1_ELECO|nr:hypothetical protein PR202_gn00449 [Eleusine coracana subsp. coracana]
MGGTCQQPTVDGPSLRDARLLENGAVGMLQGKGDFRTSDRDCLLSEPTSGAQQDDMENQQQQVCWERFLQKKTIKVLLVESDDSTRQVVSALLRHCMYEVIPAENGQQAWSYLEDMQNNIDLVLAEVFIPSVSGISLLSKIMSHNICKNIPVIMMSSTDAMSTVFKCLSKGAVDFLVKPIRKNELKNLWQHVWRRCHSSSGSGSESGIQTQKDAKLKSGDESDNNSGSNDDEDDDTSMGLNAREMAVGLKFLSAIYNFKGKDMEIGGSRNLNTDHESSPNERSSKPADRRCEFAPERNSKEKIMEILEEPTVRAADLIGSMAKNMDAQQAARAADAPNCSSKEPEGKDKNRDNVLPSLELSLKRSRSSGDGVNVIQDEQRNVLIRSDPSAFTRYHTSAASNQGGTGLVGSCSTHDNSSEAMKTDSTYNTKSNSDAAQIKQGSNGSSNNNDMGSSTKNIVTKPTTNKERITSPSIIKANAHTSAFHPVHHWTLPANATGKAKVNEVTNNAAKNAHPGEVQSNLMQHSRLILQCAHSHENGGSGTPQCGSSNVFDPPESQAANYGVNGSNTGSNNGTNRQNGSTAAAKQEMTNTEIAIGSVDKSGAGGDNGSGSGNEAYAKWIVPAPERTLREKQLTKYREKKKDRNFGKKVRYQSRQKLAEQRPRVRGQFVKQAVQDQGGREKRHRQMTPAILYASNMAECGSNT